MTTNYFWTQEHLSENNERSTHLRSKNKNTKRKKTHCIRNDNRSKSSTSLSLNLSNSVHNRVPLFVVLILNGNLDVLEWEPYIGCRSSPSFFHTTWPVLHEVVESRPTGETSLRLIEGTYTITEGTPTVKKFTELFECTHTVFRSTSLEGYLHIYKISHRPYHDTYQNMGTYYVRGRKRVGLLKSCIPRLLYYVYTPT